MKKLLFLLSIIVFSNCKSSDKTENDALLLRDDPRYFQQPTVLPNYDFQKSWAAFDWGETEAERQASDDFVAKSGFNHFNAAFLPQKPDWRALDKKYQAFLAVHKNDSRINNFRQLGSLTILRNHALLAEENEKDKIAFYTNEYLEAGGMSTSFVYYCIEALKNHISAEKKAQYASQSISRFSIFYNKVEASYDESLKIVIAGKREHEIANMKEIKVKLAVEQGFSDKLKSFSASN